MKSLENTLILSKYKPYPYQLEGIDFLLDKEDAILGDEVGLGKSLQSIVSALKYDKTLVICPAYLIINWKQEIDKISDDEFHEWEVDAYTRLHKRSTGESFDTIIIDESHYIKNSESKRTIEVMKKVISSKCKQLFMLSGTPVKNRNAEWYTQLFLAYRKRPDFRKRFPNQISFNRYFLNYVQKTVRVKNRVINTGSWEGIKPEKTRELRLMISEVHIGRKSEDHLELPEKNIVPVAVEGSWDEDLRDTWKSFCSNGGKKTPSITTMKAQNALSKAANTAKFVSDILDQGEQVIVFSDHVAPLIVITEKLRKKYGTGLITGRASMSDRDESIERFKQGKVQVLLATIGAASTGLTLTNCNKMVFNDISWVGGDLTQAMGRIRRIGQTKPCFYYMMNSGPVDKMIQNKILMKEKEIISSLEEQ